MTLAPWSERPLEQARLLNPAFVGVRLFCGNLEWSDLGHLTLLRRGLGTGSGSGISPFA
mgnify:CR=1 FL=1